MSRIGREKPYSQQVGPTGKRLCAWCERAEVGKGRRKYCGEECAEAYAVSRSPAFARLKVWYRDQGVCAICGFDSKAMRIQVDATMKDIGERSRFAVCREIRDAFHGLGFTRVHLSFLCFQSYWLWDADHIVPVVEGGQSTLENLRTLCVPCHKAETAHHKRRLGKRGTKTQQTKLFLALSQQNANVGTQIAAMMEKIGSTS